MSSRSSTEETVAGATIAPSVKPEPADHEARDHVASGQTIQGFIERVEPQRVSGWAWDKLAPEVFLEIEVQLDGKTLATTRADRFREDLKSGTGSGRHAFQAFFEEPVPEQIKHRITAVARSGTDGAAIPLVNLVGNPVGDSRASSATPTDMAQVPAGPQQWLVQLAAAHRRLQATCNQALEEIQEALAAEAARATEVAETVKDLRTMQDQLAQQLTALEVFQARFDVTLKSMEERAPGVGRSGRTDRGLRAAVAVIAMISAASLALGLWSIIVGFGG